MFYIQGQYPAARLRLRLRGTPAIGFSLCDYSPDANFLTASSTFAKSPIRFCGLAFQKVLPWINILPSGKWKIRHPNCETNQCQKWVEDFDQLWPQTVAPTSGWQLCELLINVNSNDECSHWQQFCFSCSLSFDLTAHHAMPSLNEWDIWIESCGSTVVLQQVVTWGEMHKIWDPFALGRASACDLRFLVPRVRRHRVSGRIDRRVIAKRRIPFPMRHRVYNALGTGERALTATVRNWKCGKMVISKPVFLILLDMNTISNSVLRQSEDRHVWTARLVPRSWRGRTVERQTISKAQRARVACSDKKIPSNFCEETEWAYRWWPRMNRAIGRFEFQSCYDPNDKENKSRSIRADIANWNRALGYTY